MLAVHRKLGLEPDEDQLDELGDYLDEVLPESFDQHVIVQLHSLEVRPHRRRGKVNSKKHVLITPAHPTIIEECELARQAISSFFGIGQAGKISYEEVWHEGTDQRVPDLIISKHPSFEQANTLKRRLNNNSAALPSALVLGAGIIDDTYA